MYLNSAPAKGCVWPVLAPAETLVRAGAVLRGGCWGGGEEPLRPRFAPPPPLSGKAFGARLTKPWQETQAVSHERGGVTAGDGGVALSFCAGHTFLSEYLAFVSRLLFAAERQTGRLAGCSVPISRGSGSPLERSQRPCGYRDSLVHFGFARFFMAIPTEFPTQPPAGDPEEVQEAIGKPPGGRIDLEQKAYPFAVTRNANDVRRNRVAIYSCFSFMFLWYSDCAFAAIPRGERWGCAPQTAPKSQKWKPHCGLSGLSSCGSRGCVLRGEGHSGTM